MAIYAAGLDTDHQSDLVAAIDVSDNAAAERLWTALGDGSAAARAAKAQLELSGDTHTVVESRDLRPGLTSFGQTEWSVAGQARFAAGMACTVEGGHVLGLMNQITSSQRWGLGSAGVRAQFKGGWGPGTEPGVAGGYSERQLGVLRLGGDRSGSPSLRNPRTGRTRAAHASSPPWRAGSWRTRTWRGSRALVAAEA